MKKEKRLPMLSSDDEASASVTSANLSRRDLSVLIPTQFEFSTKDARVNMRLPIKLLDAIKAAAAHRGMPYQRFIRQALEKELHG